MTHVTCRLTAKNRDQLRNPTLGNRVSATFFRAYKLYEDEKIDGNTENEVLQEIAIDLGVTRGHRK